jgi:tyrosyl-tRNA synthetase
MATSEALQQQSNDSSFPDIWEELKWRGLVAISTDEAELRSALKSSPLTFYCGFDPTAASLHLGNLVQLLVMRRLQLAGHNPLVLIGGATGLIGDPKPTAERTLNTKETVADWVERLGTQAQRFLSFEGSNSAKLVNNLDWTAPLSSIDFLRDIGKHFRVGKMLSKDAVSARLNSDAGISFTESSLLFRYSLPKVLPLYVNCIFNWEGILTFFNGSLSFSSISLIPTF